MTDGAVAFPPQDEALTLHARLLGDDPLAPSDLADAYLSPLSHWLQRIHPGMDSSMCETAAEDAILSLIKRPEAYDTSRAPLDTYLRMAAKRDLQNLQHAEWRHTSRQADWGAVELSAAARNYLADEDSDPARIVALQAMVEEMVRKRPRLPQPVLAGLSPGEVKALALVECGERRTSLYAVALGLTHLPPAAQRAEVKRVKDRLKARLRRSGVSRD